MCRIDLATISETSNFCKICRKTYVPNNALNETEYILNQNQIKTQITKVSNPTMKSSIVCT